MFRRAFVFVAFVMVTASPFGVSEVLAQTELAPIAGGLVLPSVSFNEQLAAQVPLRDVRRPAGPSVGTSLVIAMQATTVLAQVLDVHSTMSALDAGAVEANPLMAGVVKNKAAFIGVKAAVGAGLMVATHKMARRNKMAAILTSAAANAAYFFVAHHNYKVARSVR